MCSGAEPHYFTGRISLFLILASVIIWHSEFFFGRVFSLAFKSIFMMVHPFGDPGEESEGLELAPLIMMAYFDGAWSEYRESTAVRKKSF